MKVTYGSQPETIPQGMLTSIRFPTLTLLNTRTGDSVARIIEGAGFGSRDLPLSIMFQSKTSYGHDGADLVGALHEVTVDGNNVSGLGYLLNSSVGKRAALAVKTGAMRGNSVDLADVQGHIKFDETTEDLEIRFTKSNIAATTIVATPAFAAAHAVIDDERLSAEDDEIVASLAGSELVCEGSFEIRIQGPDELTASGAIVQPSEAFFVQEPDGPQKIVITDEGWVYGHLALWNSCHGGFEDRCLSVPRPVDGYASFNKPGIATDIGIVETGPIFLMGGHAYGDDLEKAYGGIENAWADVRVTAGKLGPWLSGVVRPGISDEMLYAARASRISGHWKQGKLRAIVSVNAEGFDVPGSGEMVASFQMDADGRVDDLVASYQPCSADDAVIPSFAVSNGSATLYFESSGVSYPVTFASSTSTFTVSEPPAEPVEEDELGALVIASLQAVIAAEDDEG